MPRIRTIKPELWSSPGIGELEFGTRLLFIALWNWADDYGRGTANLRELAGFAFPHDDNIGSADIRRMLGGIHRVFGVEFYTVGGRPYYAIPSWDQHQKIDKRSQPRQPAPEDGEHFNPEQEWSSELGKQKSSTDPTEPSTNPIESSPSPRRTPGAGTGEQGNRGTGEGSPTGNPKKNPQCGAARREHERFAEFYNAFPRHKDRQDAARKFQQAINAGADPDTLIAAAHRYRADTADADQQFVKYPATWLNKGSWKDEPDRKPVATPQTEVSTADQRIAQLQAMKQNLPRDPPEETARVQGSPWRRLA